MPYAVVYTTFLILREVLNRGGFLRISNRVNFISFYKSCVVGAPWTLSQIHPVSPSLVCSAQKET